MAIGLQSNFNDPRFQRALLAERASRPYAALPTAGAATAGFAGQDLATRLAFNRIGLEGLRARRQLKQSGWELDLKRKALKERKSEFLPSMLMKGGMGLWSLLEGKKAAQQQAKETALKRAYYESQIAAANRMAALGA